MKISLNWAQQYSNVNLTEVGIDKLLDKIGAQLGAIDEVDQWGPRFEGIVVVKVVSCDKHPDADKLSLCTIDDGGNTPSVKRNENGLIEVVCGAPNVHADMLAAWIPPGGTVPSTLGKEPFVLEAREIRGKVSNGMLASSAELGISDNHDGILEIKPEEVGEDLAKPGTAFIKLFNLDDTVVDVENKMFTHRPDLFGVLGDARELAGIQGLGFKSPDWYLQTPQFQSASDLPLEIKIEDYDLTPRFMAVAMKDVKVGPSPTWLQAALVRVGLKPINNVVDITNFVMHLTAQPLHAYDYDKVKARSGATPTLVARKAGKDETIALLNGKSISVSDPAIVIATDKEVVGIGGVMGGADTEVDEATKNIIIECANFNMYSIRRTAMKYGLFTDAVTRFTKGQSVLQNNRVLAQAMQLVEQLAGGQQASEVKDVHQSLPEPGKVEVSADFINQRLGLQLSSVEMKKLLENVEFAVGEQNGSLTVMAPFWRTDIEIPEDVVEEIGRLYGYDHLPHELPTRSISPTRRDALLDAKSKVRDILADAGANEVLTYSFVHGNLLEKVGQNKANAYELANAISPDLQYYRMSLLPSLLDKVHPNIKSGYSEFALFEINQVHNKDLTEDNLPVEEYRASFVYAADDKVAKAKVGAAYYEAKHYLERVLDVFGVDAVYEPAVDHEPKMEIGKAAIAPFDKNRAAYVKTKDGKLLAELGEINASVRRNLKLPKYVAGFELDIKRLLEESSGSAYTPLSRFPKVEQDISLKVSAETSFQGLYEVLQASLNELKQQDTYVHLDPLDIFQREDDPGHKQFAFRLSISSYERTLKAEEVNTLLDKIASKAKEKFGAERL